MDIRHIDWQDQRMWAMLPWLKYFDMQHCLFDDPETFDDYSGISRFLAFS